MVAPPVLDEEGAIRASALQASGESLSVSRPAEAAVASSATALDDISSVGVTSSESTSASSMLVSGLEDSSSSQTLMGGQQVSLTAPSSEGRSSVGSLSVLEAYSSLLDSSLFDSLTATAAAAAAHDASSRSPQSLPFSGTPPIPASGSTSGGSAPSSGGTGPHLSGALAFVLIALLGGKFLWYRRDFLKPDSPFQLIVNQPG